MMLNLNVLEEVAVLIIVSPVHSRVFAPEEPVFVRLSDGGPESDVHFAVLYIIRQRYRSSLIFHF